MKPESTVETPAESATVVPAAEPGTCQETWPFELPALAHDHSAFEPLVSAETMATHHGKHHAAYVETLNGLVEGTEHATLTLQEIIRSAGGSLFDNAAQHWNHAFYWKCMSPDGGGDPEGAVAEALTAAWGSVDEFRKSFTEAALGTFGSGWTWLVAMGDGLAIVPTKDAGTPLTGAGSPLLVLDVWEHAYYIDHRNDRAAHVAAFWELVDWQHVASRLQGAAGHAATREKESAARAAASGPAPGWRPSDSPAERRGSAPPASGR